MSTPLTFEFALLRPFNGEAPSAAVSADYLSAGEYSGLPFAEARVAFESEMATMGLSGHIGQLDYGIDSVRNDRTTTYALAGDAQLTTGALGLRGEVALSQNNRGLLGLAGTRIVDRGLAPANLDELEDGRSTHLWGQLSYTVGSVNLNAGVGLERTNRDQYNRMVFANTIYTMKLLPVAFALEVSNLATKLDAEVQHNTALNLAARYSF